MASTPLTEALREALALFSEPGVPKTTTEVADQLDLGRRSTYERLERLVDHGRLETKKVGANARVWWQPPSNTNRDAQDWSTVAGSLMGDVLDRAEIGVFVLNESFEVAWVNEAAERYFGFDREHVLGRDKRGLIEERFASVVEDGETFAETVLATYDDNTYTEQFECHVTAGDERAERWLDHRSKPIESGRYAGGRVELYYDVTDRKRVERARKAERRQFKSLVEAVEEYAIFMLDTDGYVQTWNSGAERIKGYEAADILGEHFSTFYPEGARAAGVPEQNLSVAAEHGSVEDEGWRVRADGSRFWANATITAIRDDDGALRGYAKITRDMTDRREYEQELRRERDLTEQLLETAPIRLAVFLADGSIERMNSRARQQLDIDESAISEFSIEDLELYDADGTPIQTANHPALKVIETGEPVSDRLVQHDGPDGNRRWVSLTAAPLPDEDGAVERGVIAGKDVTDLKQKERQLERQRDELEQELAEVFERVDDAFYALDEELRFEYVNDTAETYLGKSEPELLGGNVWEVVDIDEDDPLIEKYETAMASQEPLSFERYSDPLGIWTSVSVYPSSTGLSVYFRDITEQKKRERDLRDAKLQLEAAAEAGAVGTWEWHIPDDRFVAGASLARTFGVDPEAAQDGVSLEQFVSAIHEDDRERIERRIQEAVESCGEYEEEYRVRNADDELRWVMARGHVECDEDGNPTTFPGALIDITERKERERELKQYRTIVETVEDGVYVLDDENRFQLVNDAHAALTGYDRDDLLGAHASLVTDEEYVTLADEAADQLRKPGSEATTVETELVTSDGERIPVETRFTILPIGNGGIGRVGIVRDISERKKRERELWNRVRQQEIVADLGTRALEDLDLDTLMAETADLVAETLDNDYCKILDLDMENEELLLRQGVGWGEGIIGKATVSAVNDDSQAAYTLATEQPVVVEDLTTEPRFSGPDLLRNHDVRSGISTIIGPLDNPWGILGTHDTDRKDFSEQDGIFVQSVANILAAAIDRHHHEEELVHQREQLEALNSLNEVVREITDAVLNQSTREKIETTVCERLAGSDSYVFAWTGEVETASETVTLRTEAGVEGYLDNTTISVAPEDEHSEGPTGKALRTGEMQVTNDIYSDPEYEPWPDHAESYGIRSSAAIPIVHEDIIYGVLNVYSDRPHAFEAQERDIIRQLGEVVGHAIAAIERKRALLSDEVTEIEFVVPEFIERAGTKTDVDGTITFDRVVPAGNEAFLVYGTVEADAIHTLEVLVEQLSYIEEVSIFDQDPDTVWFELQLSDLPLMSIIASHGGHLQQARLADGDFYLTIQFPTTVDTRRIMDAIGEVYPMVTMLRRRQVTRNHDSSAPIEQTVMEDLTDRQRAALEAAVFSGYFEWPRDTTGQEIAESLGVSQATFSQHLRKAERKVFESIFSTPVTA